MAFNMTTGRFLLEFVADPSIDAPTEVYVNRELGGGVAPHYANGVEVQVTQGLSWVLNGSKLTIYAAHERGRFNASVSVVPK